MRSDDFLEDDVDERDRRSASAIFASGWFRAVLVLGVLAITLVVAVPYVLRWMQPAAPKQARQVARPVDLRPSSEASTAAPLGGPAPVSAPGATGPTPPSASVPLPPPTPPASPSAVPTPASSATSAPATPAAPVPPVGPAAPPKMAQAPVTERLVPAPSATPDREIAPAKPAAADADTAKIDAHGKTAARHDPTPAKVASAPPARGGAFWVQVGAFQHERNAEALARKIRGMKMPVQTTRRMHAQTVAATAPRHEVFVMDAPVATVNAALRGQGRAQAVRGGVAVQPPLELKEAVALSRRLTGEGLSVKIRRVGGDAAIDSPTTYVVRVGGYATRGQAEAARRELAGKGVKGFVADTPAR